MTNTAQILAVTLPTAPAISEELAATLVSRFSTAMQGKPGIRDTVGNTYTLGFKTWREAIAAVGLLRTGQGLPPLDVSRILDGFCRAAIFADAPEGTKPRATQAARVHAAAMLEKLYALEPVAVLEALNCAEYVHKDAPYAALSFGHDLYLTCAGHGAGFWDRDTLPDGVGDKLSDCIRKHWREFHTDAQFYRGWLTF